MELQAAETQAGEAHPVRARWPDAVAYREAIRNPRLVLSDPELLQAAVVPDGHGLPLAYSGRFAVVFRLRSGRGDGALRCFTRPGDDTERRERYRAIAARLEHLPDDFVAFRFLERGIRVRSRWYPVVAMRWAEGETLGRFVEAHRADPAALLALCRSLTRLLQDLEGSGVAHGDWQHDNLLVSERGRKVTLVDYDGMYVPELAGRAPGEMGHPNYQHPARTASDYGVGLDRFAHLAMQTALLALARAPFLWDEFSDGESLLFRRSDFLDPKDSPVFAALRRHCGQDAFLHDRLDRLEAASLSGRAGVFPGNEAVQPLPETYRSEVSIRSQVRTAAEAAPRTVKRPAPTQIRRGVRNLLAAGAVLCVLSYGVVNIHDLQKSAARVSMDAKTWTERYKDDLQGANLQKARLTQARLHGADLREADLRSASLWRADLGGADLRGADLRGADLQRARLPGARLQKANFERARLQRAQLENADLQGTNLRKAWLYLGDLSKADARGADFQGAMLRGARLPNADLRGANLGNIDLYLTDFQGANLRKANLERSRLRDANVRDADLRNANLHRAILWNSRFTDADLRGANLQKADLQGTDLRKADLRGADLRGAFYDKQTKWTPGFDPGAQGAVLLDWSVLSRRNKRGE